MSFEVLYLRRPKIDYVSPPICEGIFSSTGSTIIVLEPFGVRTKITGLLSGGQGGFHLSWNNYPGALCYNIYFSEDGETYTLIAECVEDTEFDVSGPGFYRVSAITPDGETELSDPVQIISPPPPCNPFIDNTGLDNFGDGGTRYDISSDGTVAGYKANPFPRPWSYHARINGDLRTARDSGTIQASQALDLVDSNSSFFVPSDVGKFLKFDSGGNARKILTYVSPAEVQVNISDTVASSEFTIYGQTIGGDSGIAILSNGNGQLVGDETDELGNNRMFWFNRNTGEIRNLADANVYIPIDLNNSGFLLYTDNTSGFVYNPNTQTSTNIGTLDSEVVPLALNDNSVVVGSYRIDLFPSPSQNHAFKWQSGTMTDIHPAEAGTNDSQSKFITNTGFIVGAFTKTVGIGTRDRVFYNNGGSSISIGTLSADGDVTASDVNESNTIVGLAESAGSGSPQHAFRWTLIGGIEDLGIPAGFDFSLASSINSSGIIVGEGHKDSNPNNTALIYISGVWHELTDYLPAASGWTALYSAQVITNNNEIIGFGLYGGDFRRYFLKLCL